jgi:hypothetical protein
MIYKVTSASAARSISRYVLLALSIASCLLLSARMDASSCKTAADASHLVKAVLPLTSIEQSTTKIVDRSTGLTWVRVTNCEHLDWPAHLVLSPGSVNVATERIGRPGDVAPLYESKPVVRTGDTVRLWSADDVLHVEVDAIAEETKETGDRIRIRLPQGSTSYSQEPARHFVGVVRGRGSVELIR